MAASPCATPGHYAYLAAGTVYQRFLEDGAPIHISTSSIALQRAMRDEYLPLLSTVLMADGMTAAPIRAVIRKGKSHYVCDERLESQLGQLDLSKKNWKAGNALLSLRKRLDLDGADCLSRYDRERVCVPQVCDCKLGILLLPRLFGELQREPILVPDLQPQPPPGRRHTPRDGPQSHPARQQSHHPGLGISRI